MKKNGFTLIEVLAVLVVISFLFAFSYPAIKNSINSSKTTVIQTQINTILTAAYDFTVRHTEFLPTSNTETKLITLAELKQENLIDVDIMDPKTQQPYSNDLIIEVTLSQSSNIDTSISKKEGDYLYRINYNADETKKPVIELNSNITDKTVEINDLYADPDPSDIETVKNSNGSAITDYKTIIVITKNNSIVDRVSTSQYTNYDISYTIKTNNSAATKTIKIAIVDNESPTIEKDPSMSSTETINLGDNFDINNGITCSDNSGECKIIINGSVDINKKGTYTIQYSAVDPSGNKSQSVITRIIKVE